MTDEVIIRDFSKTRPRIFLGLDGKQYEARPAIGLPTLQKIQQIQRKFRGADVDKLPLFREIFQVLLKSSDVDSFLAKLDDEDDPVDPGQLEGMVAYLMEIHAERPTREPSALPTGSSDVAPGTPSTDGVRQVG
jgi:hypothetical protein